MTSIHEAAIHRLIVQDYAARLYLSFHEEPIPFQRGDTTYEIVTGNLTNHKVVAKLDGEKQYETLEISDQEVAYFQEYCYRQLYETYAQDERARQEQAESTTPVQAETAEQVEATCRRSDSPVTPPDPQMLARLILDQEEHIRTLQAENCRYREREAKARRIIKRLRQHEQRVASVLHAPISALIDPQTPAKTVPLAAYKQEHERRTRAEQRLYQLRHSPYKPTERLIIDELQYQLEHPQKVDRDGFARINYETAAKRISMSASTPPRSIKAVLEQTPDFPLECKWDVPEINQDGNEIKCLYARATVPDLITIAPTLALGAKRVQGGNKYFCNACGSDNTIILRRLHCNTCGHETDLEPTYPNGKLKSNTGKSSKSNLNPGSEDTPATENFLPSETQPVGMVITSYPPDVVGRLRDDATGDENQEVQDDGPLSRCEQEVAVALYQAIAGTDAVHIKMVPEPGKWKTIPGEVTAADILAHIEGRKTLGTRLYHEAGMTRAFLVDADNEEELVALRAGACKLAAAGFFPIEDSPPADRPRVKGFHEVSAHGWIVMDGLVDRQAGWSEIVRLAPEWGQLRERWPKLPEEPKGNRVRLPGGNYVMPGFAGFTLLSSVRDGEYARTGVDQARLLLAHQSLASLVPSVPCDAGGAREGQQVRPSPLSGEAGETVELKEQRACGRAGGDRPLPEVDEAWVKKYGPVEATTLYFAVTEACSVSWFNEHNSLESLRPREENGKALSPNGDERTASTGYWDSSEGERYTDFSGHGLRTDGSHDSGDAFELACKLRKCSKSELSKETMREILRQARAELEAAAHAGREPRAEVCVLTTPAGWCYYDCLQFKAGELVTWCSVPRGGYGSVYPVDGEVVKVGPARVTIRVQKKDGSYVDRVVLPEHLVPRQPEPKAAAVCPIYVDEIRTYETTLPYKQWCHMAVAGPLEQLHAFADRLGLKREWFQDKPNHPHYDLTPAKRALAIKLGAVPVSSVELVKRCHAARLSPVSEQPVRAERELEEYDGYVIDQDGDYIF